MILTRHGRAFIGGVVRVLAVVIALVLAVDLVVRLA